MALARLTPDELRATTADALGAPWEGDLSIELLAAALRRAAGVLCPCPPGELTRSVVRSLQGLSPNDVLPGLVGDTLDALLAYGDLLELAASEEPGGPRRRLIYAAPPTFVLRPSGDAYLVGVAPEQPALLPPALQAEVVADGVTRRLPAADKPSVRALRDLGLLELPDSVWLWYPAQEPAGRFLGRLDRRLDKEDPVTSVDDIEAFDASTPTDRYRARWITTPTLSGRTVVRREQRYGAPLWAYAELQEGRPVRLLDLPAPLDKKAPASIRACDQAWRIQAALDAVAGHPQRLVCRTVDSADVVLDLFAPPPAWLARRWTVIGRPAPRSGGSLFAFALPSAEAPAEARLAIDHLWLSDAS